MMRRFLTIGGIVAFVLLPSARSFGQQDLEAQQGVPSCAVASRELLAKEQRLLRSVLYGQRPAIEARTGTVRADAEGNLWVKTNVNAWQTLATGFTQTQC